MLFEMKQPCMIYWFYFINVNVSPIFTDYPVVRKSYIYSYILRVEHSTSHYKHSWCKERLFKRGAMSEILQSITYILWQQEHMELFDQVRTGPV